MGEEVSQNIACELGKIMSKRGIKQTWICEKTGMSSAVISRLVNGQAYPTLLLAYKISRLLNVGIEELWPLRKDSPINNIGKEEEE